MPHNNFKSQVEPQLQGIQFDEPNFDQAIKKQIQPKFNNQNEKDHLEETQTLPLKESQENNVNMVLNQKCIKAEITDSDTQTSITLDQISVNLDTNTQFNVYQLIQNLQVSKLISLNNHLAFFWDQVSQYWIYLGIISSNCQTLTQNYSVDFSKFANETFKLKFQRLHQQVESTSHNLGEEAIIQNQSSQSNANYRVKERYISLAYQKVKEWRQLYVQGYKDPQTGIYQKINLDKASKIVGLSRKTLDDYYKQIQIGEMYGFDFHSNMDKKIGVLRQFNAQHLHQNLKNKKKKTETQTQIQSTDPSLFESSHLSDSTSIIEAPTQSQQGIYQDYIQENQLNTNFYQEKISENPNNMKQNINNINSNNILIETDTNNSQINNYDIINEENLMDQILNQDDLLPLDNDFQSHIDFSNLNSNNFQFFNEQFNLTGCSQFIKKDQ